MNKSRTNWLSKKSELFQTYQILSRLLIKIMVPVFCVCKNTVQLFKKTRKVIEWRYKKSEISSPIIISYRFPVSLIRWILSGHRIPQKGNNFGTSSKFQEIHPFQSGWITGEQRNQGIWCNLHYSEQFRTVCVFGSVETHMNRSGSHRNH